MTKQVFQALEPASAVQATQLAIKHAMAGQPGPVAVLYSLASLSGSVDAESEPRLYATSLYLPPAPQAADASLVAAAARALAAAKNPVIIAGNGVRIAQAYEPLEQLAETLGIPVVTTASGKGVFAETHGLALGVFGTFGLPAANAAVAEADLVLVVGSKLGASDTARENPELLNPARQSFIQIEIEPRNASWTFPAEHVLMGDAALVLEQLRAAVSDQSRDEQREAGARRVAAHRKRHGYFDADAYEAPTARRSIRSASSASCAAICRRTPSSPAMRARTAS